MSRRWSVYHEVQHKLVRSGITADVAAEAARLADLAVRRRRNACICAAKAAKMSTREIARLWGLSNVHVHRITRVLPDDVDR